MFGTESESCTACSNPNFRTPNRASLVARLYFNRNRQSRIAGGWILFAIFGRRPLRARKAGAVMNFGGRPHWTRLIELLGFIGLTEALREGVADHFKTSHLRHFVQIRVFDGIKVASAVFRQDSFPNDRAAFPPARQFPSFGQ